MNILFLSFTRGCQKCCSVENRPSGSAKRWVLASAHMPELGFGEFLGF